MSEKRIITILLAILMIALTGCAKPEVKVTEEPAPEPEEEISEVKTYCFLGTDKRSDSENGRSDVIMLIRVDPDTKDVKLLSVYRDTLLDVDGLAKCNAAYSYGGPKFAVDMLERNLDINIDGYMTADFLSVIQLIDALGGITIDITDEEAGFANGYIRSMNKAYGYNSPELTGGTQNLDGVQAVGYARVRYTEGWDYRRTERQRTVLSLAAEKMKAADKDTQEKVLEIILTSFNTNLSGKKITDLSDQVLSYEISESKGFPLYKKGKNIDGLGDCVVPDDLEKNVTWLHAYLYGEEEYTPSDEVKEINKEIISR